MREHRRKASPAQRSRSATFRRVPAPCPPTTVSHIGRSPHIPRSAVKEATAQVSSPALWSRGRRGRIPIPAAAPVFSRGGWALNRQTVHTPARSVDIPAKRDCSNSSRSHALWGYGSRNAVMRVRTWGAGLGLMARGVQPRRFSRLRSSCWSYWEGIFNRSNCDPRITRSPIAHSSANPAPKACSPRENERQLT